MLLAGALLLAQYAGTLDLGQTSRLDARAAQPLPQIATPPSEIALAADASLAVSARLRVSDRRWDWLLSYSPSFGVTDLELSPAAPVLSNAGTLGVVWHDRSVRLSLSESGSIARETIANLYATPVAGQTAPGSTTTPPGGTTTPPGGTTMQPGGTTTQPSTAVGQNGTTNTTAVPTQSFWYMSSNTTGSLSVRASPRLLFSLFGGFSLSGNLENTTQINQIYPEQYGPSASATMFYTSSLRDTFVTSASGQNTTTLNPVCVTPTAGTLPTGTTATTCGRQDVPLISLQQSARHALSDAASIGGSVGLSGTIYQLNTGSAWGILPTFGINFLQRLSRDLHDPRGANEGSSFRAAVELDPTINVFTGAPSSRLQVTSTFTNRLSSLFVFAYNIAATKTVDFPHADQSPLTLISGAVDLRIRVSKLIALSLGIQAFWQDQLNVGTLPTPSMPAPANTATSSWVTTTTEVGYVALSARLPTLKL
jgi:hypothetical protein